jgi:hypothetical protein
MDQPKKFDSWIRIRIAKPDLGPKFVIFAQIDVFSSLPLYFNKGGKCRNNRISSTVFQKLGYRKVWIPHLIGTLYPDLNPR